MENAAVINLKKRHMIFEGKDVRVILPLDPSQGERYMEPLRKKDQDDVEPIHNIPAQVGGYEDPPTTSWESGSSCMTESEDDLEGWRHRPSSTRPPKSLRWLSSEPSILPTFDGSTDPDPFIVQFSGQIPESQKMTSLELSLRVTAARWWKIHKPQIPSWEYCQRFLRLRFKDQLEEVRSKFDGKSSPQEHLAKCYEAWKYVPQDEWVHRFVHTLGPLAKNWYAEAEIRQDTVS